MNNRTIPLAETVTAFIKERDKAVADAESLAEAVEKAIALNTGISMYQGEGEEIVMQAWPVEATRILREALADYRGEK